MEEAGAYRLPRRWFVLAFAALIIAAGLATFYTINSAFPHGTGVLDEASYQAQANAMKHGDLTLARSTHDPFFRPFLSGVHGDKVVFKYQPVWPAMIATSDALFGSSVPLRVLMSVLGMCSVAWLAWEVTRDQRVALVAGLFLLASAFAWVQSASLLGYQLAFVLGTATAAALFRTLRVRSFGSGAVAGALLGLAVLHRPYDAALAIVPALVYVCWRAAREHIFRRWALSVAAGGLPFAIIFFAYNQVVMGSPFKMAFTSSGDIDTFGFGWRASFVVPNGGRGGQIHYTPGLALSTMGRVFGAFPAFIGFFPAVIVGLAVAIIVKRRDQRFRVVLVMMLVILIGYYFWWGNANLFHFHLDRAMGPFYDYPLLGPLLVAAGWGLFALPANARVALIIVGASWTGWNLVNVMHHAQLDGKNRAAELAGFDGQPPALILANPLFPNDPYVRFANEPDLTGKTVVARDVGGRRLELLERFPDRNAYLIRSYRSFGDVNGPIRSDRVPLTLTKGDAISIHERALVPAGTGATSYMRIGYQPPAFGPSGGPVIDATWHADAASLHMPPGVTTQIAIGITTAPAGAPAPTAMTENWFECRIEARAEPDGKIVALTPCEGWHHYQFPDLTTLEHLEDVSPVLNVNVDPAPATQSP